VQFIAVAATWAFAFIGTFILLSILKVIMGLRVSAEEEIEGLDIEEHGEVAYSGFQLTSSMFSTAGYPLIPMTEKRAEALGKAILDQSKEKT